MNYPLPNNLEWWKIFGVKFEDMEYIMATILELYEMKGDDGKPGVSTQYVEKIVKDILYA